MKTVDHFLAEVASSRLETQIEERKAFRTPRGFELPSALEIALRHQWQIAPVLARSGLAMNSASAGVPSSDYKQIEYWVTRYPEANWSLVTGPASDVTALEIETRFTSSWLADFTEDEVDWPRTLRFTSGSRWFVLFASNPAFQSLAVYPGLRLHTRTRILIPPSRLPNGDQTGVCGSACASARSSQLAASPLAP